MRKYSKFFVAFVGLALMIALNYYGINVPGLNEIGIQLIVAALTAGGVYQVRNVGYDG